MGWKTMKEGSNWERCEWGRGKRRAWELVKLGRGGLHI